MSSKHAPIPLSIFNDPSSAWTVLDSRESQPCNLPRLNIVSFNVYFDDFAFEKRYHAQADLFDSIPDPCVIGLQEVTDSYVKLLAQDPSIQARFALSDNPNEMMTFGIYGVLLLISKDLLPCLRSIRQLSLPSEMGRSFVHCEFCLLDASGSEFGLSVGTVHLESLANAPLRKTQLRLISNEVQSHFSSAICVGDFNFDSERNFDASTLPLENDTLSTDDWANYHDAWSFLHPTERGFTFDTVENEMLHSRPHVIINPSLPWPGIVEEQMV